jgi:dUTP pyrophosphatase
MKLRVQKLSKSAKLPSRAHEGDAGLDLYALEPVVLMGGGFTSVGTGIALEIPEDFAGFVQPRSGLALKHGITVLNSPGLIDSGYRGEIRVILYNASKIPFTIREGDKIAQLVVVPAPKFDPIVVDSLEETDRSDRGFGSTGI